MANPFVKGWKYLMALFDSKLDERADPKVQIQQAMETAQRQHQALLQQAAAVIGNQRQLEMKLSRQLTEVEQLQAQARQALALADQARAGGDTAKADELERTAQTFATGLVAAENSLQDLKQLHDQALSAAGQARDAVKNSDMLLKQKEAERMKLMSQLEQAKMQETMARSLESVNNLAVPANSPSLDEVRDKIERRYAMALGRSDLAKETVEGRRLEVQRATIDLAGAARLAEIRASMASEAGAIPAGEGKAAIGEAGHGAAAIGEAGHGAAAIGEAGDGGAAIGEAGHGAAASGGAASGGAASGAAIKAGEDTPPADASRS